MSDKNQYYLKIGRASDLQDKKERIVYRFLEILPGAASWLTLFLVIFISWWKPFAAAIFIICFVVYYLFRNFYFMFHSYSCYKRMRKEEKVDWLSELDRLPEKRWQNIFQLIVLPMYKEPIEVVEDAFKRMLETDWPKEKMIVVLSCEEKGAKDVAEKIKEKYGDNFFKFLLTFHPFGLSGEMAGKGSNETWGARKVKEEIIDPLKIPYENIIYSSLDVDTCVYPKYFSCLAYYYLTVKNSIRCSFQPVPLFFNNIWQAPPISKVFAFAASFWEMTCQERPEKLITFSSHSMSFNALVDVDFRQVNVVSDDSRIFWQCFLRYDGDYRVIPLYYPISMDANVAPTFLRTIKNVYLQQRRWAYGVGDLAYLFFGFLKNKKIPLSQKIYFGAINFEGHWAWATNSLIIFFLGWLPLILGGEKFSQTMLSYKLPTFMRDIMTFGNIGLIFSAYLSIILLSPSLPNSGKKKYLLLVLEWFLLPVIMIFFYAFPALESQTRWMFGKYLGFWPTPKIRK